MEKISQENKQDIQQLKELAGSMTFREFLAWVVENCTGIVLMGDNAAFRYQSVEGTVNAKDDCLGGVFYCYDRGAVMTTYIGPRTFFKYESSINNTK